MRARARTGQEASKPPARPALTIGRESPPALESTCAPAARRPFRGSGQMGIAGLFFVLQHFTESRLSSGV
eukprot:scaffold28945_cov112-Isochrysis_galbana.AAC.2